MAALRPRDGDPATRSSDVVLALLAAPGLSHDIAQSLARDLPELLRRRAPEVPWRVEVQLEPRAGAAGANVDLVDLARRRMLEEGWRFVICLTDLPLHVARHPVTAHVSVSLGVGLVSVPALGPVAMETNVRQAVLRVIDRLLGSGSKAPRQGPPGPIPTAVLQELASPVGHADVEEGGTVRYVTAVVLGNLRLVLGMVRANRPWQLVTSLSGALVAALGTAAFGITSPGIWMIVEGAGWPRMVAVAVASVVSICASMIIVHGLWERSPSPPARERVILMNVATVATITIGILVHYVALFVINLVGAVALIDMGVIQQALKRPVGFEMYLELAWLVASLATVGGALGAALESDQAVRAAAYGYRAEDREAAPAQGDERRTDADDGA